MIMTKESHIGATSSIVINKGKRGYSKGGCRECKRRKIKCSEDKPNCLQCDRLNKLCAYPTAGERIPRVSRKVLQQLHLNSIVPGNQPGIQKPNSKIQESRKEELEPLIPQSNDTSNSQNRTALKSGGFSTGMNTLGMELENYNTHDIVQKYIPTSITSLLNDNSVAAFKDPLAELNNTNLQISTVCSTFTQFSPSMLLQDYQQFRNTVPYTFSHNQNMCGRAGAAPDVKYSGSLVGAYTDKDISYDQHDLNVLAADLNNLVSDIIFESKFNDKIPSDKETELILNHAIHRENNSITEKESISVPRNVSFDHIKVSKCHEKLYLEYFYNDFANIILPFRSYDKTLKTYFNPARDIILKYALKESLLLAAILAQGAKTAFKKNHLAEDKEAYGFYLSKCLKLLGPALSNNCNTKDNSKLQSNIELVLITVLLLASANASNRKQDWRQHLRGAKDLLLKISASKNQYSKVLIFCKFWYVSFEILAGLSSSIGGTLRTNQEIDLLITSGNDYEVNVLMELGVIHDSGFNVICGFYNGSIPYFRNLIKSLNKIRNSGNGISSNDSFEHLKLLSEFYEQSKIEIIMKGSIISPSDFPNNEIPEDCLLEQITCNNRIVVINWMDTSHQAYILASIITILTQCAQVSYDSNIIQDLTEKLVNLISFLSYTTDVPESMIKALMMIQWPMFIAGMNCIQENSKYLLMKFFRTSAQIGSGSAEISLKKLYRIWSLHESGAKNDCSYEEESLAKMTY